MTSLEVRATSLVRHSKVWVMTLLNLKKVILLYYYLSVEPSFELYTLFVFRVSFFLFFITFALDFVYEC